jgi:hypothetical protein
MSTHISIKVLSEASVVQEFVDEAIRNLQEGMSLDGEGLTLSEVDCEHVSSWLAELKLKVDDLYSQADQVDDFFNGRGCSLSDIAYL